MSGELEAAGAAVTAGLVAGAVEGRRGGHGKEAHGDCLNCGATLAGEYCHVCGQPSHISRTLGDVFHDFLHGVLHFDTKAWKTLPLLFFRPGMLTRRYILGQRARFIGPVALFLFTVFLMFFVFALVGGQSGAPEVERSDTVTALTAQVEDGRADLARYDAQIAEAQADAGPGAAAVIETAQMSRRFAAERLAQEEAELAQAQQRAALYAKGLAWAQQQIAAAEAAGESDEVAALSIVEDVLTRAVAGDGAVVEGLVITEAADGSVERINFGLGSTLQSRNTIFDEIRRQNEAGRIQVNTGIASWDAKIREKLSDPELAWYKIQNAAYKFSWLLVPISIPFVALLFLWRRGVTLFDHAVFVLYSLSFVSFMAILAVIFARVFPPDVSAPITSTLTLLIPIHMFFQLKGGYQLGWWSTIWRSVFLWVFAIICLTVFFIAIVLLGLVG